MGAVGTRTHLEQVHGRPGGGWGERQSLLAEDPALRNGGHQTGLPQAPFTAGTTATGPCAGTVHLPPASMTELPAPF